MTSRAALTGLLVWTLAACGPSSAPDGGAETGTPAADAARDAPPAATPDGAVDAARDAGTGPTDASTAAPDASTDGGGPAPGDGGRPGGAGAWIRMHFAGAAARTGDFRSRTSVETPALVHDATGCCAKYAFDVRESAAPDDRRVGFVNVTIRNLMSADAFGAGIQTASAAGVTLFLSNVTIDPGWPTWVDYATTNYDGLVLDEAAAIYAEDLTIRNWNADGAIDNKAPVSQFVRLTIEGRGNRGIRYWGAGPHYLVASTLRNEGGLGEGSLLWFRNCATVRLRVYDSTFNGSRTVPPGMISCDEGSSPSITYLTTDPRTTGEMHEMFTP